MAGDLAFAAILELGRLLRTRRVSATELAELFLERLERFGPRYNCLVTVTPERALAAAARADRELAAGKIRGPLHGIPYGVKDLVAVRGNPLEDVKELGKVFFVMKGGKVFKNDQR